MHVSSRAPPHSQRVGGHYAVATRQPSPRVGWQKNCWECPRAAATHSTARGLFDSCRRRTHHPQHRRHTPRIMGQAYAWGRHRTHPGSSPEIKENRRPLEALEIFSRCKFRRKNSPMRSPRHAAARAKGEGRRCEVAHLILYCRTRGTKH